MAGFATGNLLQHESTNKYHAYLHFTDKISWRIGGMMNEEQKERDWIEHMTDSQREEYLKSKNKLLEIITGETKPIIKNNNMEAPRTGLCECGHMFSFHNWTCQAENCKCQKSFDELLIDENNALRAKLEMAKEAMKNAISYHDELDNEGWVRHERKAFALMASILIEALQKLEE